MGYFRSKSFGDSMMDMEVYGSSRPPPPPSASAFHNLRSYSASCASFHGSNHPPKDFKLKKGNSTSSSSSSSKGGWSLSDPELQRKKRVAGYKAYSVEGKVKGSFRNSFKWLKDRCSQVVYGW